MATRDPVAITGVGIVCALGSSRAAVAEACRRGDRPFAKIRRFDAAAYKVDCAAEVIGLDARGRFGRQAVRHTSHTDRLALWAAADALAQAGLSPARQRGAAVLVGASSGGMEEMEREAARHHARGAGGALRPSPSVAFSYPVWATARCLAAQLGLEGSRATYMTACSSAAHALGIAMHRVRRGDLDVALAGGAEALCRLTLAGFGALGVLDPAVTRPFCRSRAGITLGEGAAFFVLERLPEALGRGAPVLAVLGGYGASSDAHHMVHPREDGRGALAAMQAALSDAGLAPEDLDYINAHGTGTLQNDAMEGRAIDALLAASAGRRAPPHVASSKSMLGHTLGAAGALEAALTVLGMVEGFMPPNPGVAPDEAMAFSAARLATSAPGEAPRVALSTSFAFGGNNAALVLCRPEVLAAASRPAAAQKHLPGPAVITGAALSGPHGTAVGADELLALFDRVQLQRHAADLASRGTLLGLTPGAVLDPKVSRRMDPLSAAVTATLALAVRHSGAAPGPGWGVGVGTSFGALEQTRAFLARLFAKGPALTNPLDFPNLVHNAAAGYASITFAADGPSLASCQEELCFDEALRSMVGRIRAGHLEGALCGGADLASEALDAGYAAIRGAAAPGAGHASLVAGLVLERAAGVGANRRAWAEVVGTGNAGPTEGPAGAARRALGAVQGGAAADLWLTGASTDAQRAREDEVLGIEGLRGVTRLEARRWLGDAGGAAAAVIAVGAAFIACGRARRVLVTSVTLDGAAAATLLGAPAARS